MKLSKKSVSRCWKIMANSNENIIETELKTEIDAQELIQMLKKEIKQNLNKIEQVHSIILFGSLARLEITDDSDIDICILLKEGAEKPLEDKI
ncbi:MAG: nucleotidyltransferase domain-containing protein, partial [Promethearchaeota archaeon]